MKNRIFSALVSYFLPMLLQQITSDQVDDLVKTILEKTRELVKSSENQIDDTIILPLLDRLEEVLLD